MAGLITLDKRSAEIQYLCKKDKRLAKVIEMVGPISYEIADNAYAYVFVIHEIIEQMLSVKAAAKIFGRLEELCEGSISPEKINRLSNAEIKSIGTSNTKVGFIRAVTDAILSGQFIFEELDHLSDQAAMKKLMTLHGVGTWTAKMYLLFILNRSDILPFEDVAFLQSYKWMYKTEDTSPKSVIKRCKKWSPYSSIGARYLYRALDMGLTKEEFHLFT